MNKIKFKDGTKMTPSKIIGIGLNYVKHIDEMKRSLFLYQKIMVPYIMKSNLLFVLAEKDPIFLLSLQSIILLDSV